MILGLRGPSCSGKTFFFNILRAEGFSAPLSVTTRAQRAEESAYLRSVTRERFEELRVAGRLSLVTNAFGNLYACVDLENLAENGDVVLVITMENIPELRSMGGVVLRILPEDPGICVREIRKLNRNNEAERIADLLAEHALEDGVLSDYTFRNRYDAESAARFRDMVRAIKRRV